MAEPDTLAICVDDIATTAQVLLRRHRALGAIEDLVSADSFPTQSVGGGGGATNELDDDGTPIPQHSDPTFRAVEARDNARTNPARAARKIIEQKLYAARRILDEANSLAQQLDAPPTIDEAANDRHDKMWCTNHTRHGMNEPVRPDAPDTGLCRWCAVWKHDAEHRHRTALDDGTPNPEHDPGWPLLPPGNVLERRARGDNITSRVLTECGLGTRREPPNRLSKKQRRRART